MNSWYMLARMGHGRSVIATIKMKMMALADLDEPACISFDEILRVVSD